MIVNFYIKNVKVQQELDKKNCLDKNNYIFQRHKYNKMMTILKIKYNNKDYKWNN